MKTELVQLQPKLEEAKVENANMMQVKCPEFFKNWWQNAPYYNQLNQNFIQWSGMQIYEEWDVSVFIGMTSVTDIEN